MNRDDNISGSCAKRYNDREGFEQFGKMIEGYKAKHCLSDILIGMEQTGHYWRKLVYFAEEHGYEVLFVGTTALQHHQELDKSSFAKSDRREALTMANITPLAPCGLGQLFPPTA
jgi:transposase